MNETSNRQAQDAVASIYRDESPRVLATLIRLLGDFDLAEEALHDAFAAALAQWPREGVPGNPRAWLVSTGRFKAIDALRGGEPSPVVALNRAAAVAMRDGPAAGLELMDAILARGELADYQPAHAARADLCRRLGRTAEAREAYQRALALTGQAPQRRFIEKRLQEL